MCFWLKSLTMMCYLRISTPVTWHRDVIEWKHFRHYCPIVRGIHQSQVDSPHKGTVTQTFDVSLLSVQTSVQQTLICPLIWDAIAVIWLRCSGKSACFSTLFVQDITFPEWVLSIYKPHMELENCKLVIDFCFRTLFTCLLSEFLIADWLFKCCILDFVTIILCMKLQTKQDVILFMND